MADNKARTLKLTLQDSAGPDQDLCFILTRSGEPGEVYGNWDIAVEYPSIDGRRTELFELSNYPRINGTTGLALSVMEGWHRLWHDKPPVDSERGLSVRAPQEGELRKAVITRARAAVSIAADASALRSGDNEEDGA